MDVVEGWLLAEVRLYLIFRNRCLKNSKLFSQDKTTHKQNICRQSFSDGDAHKQITMCMQLMSRGQPSANENKNDNYVQWAVTKF